MKKMTVYKDDNFFSAFPSIVRLRDGTLMVVFRRAPARKPFSTHLDSMSKAVAVYSKDNGNTWSEAETVYEEDGDVGVQDPSVTQLKDGTLIVNFFLWKVVKQEPFNHYIKGIYVLRSFDCGKTWEDIPHAVCDGTACGVSEPVVEMPDGKLIIPVYNGKGSFIFSSSDKGETWEELSIIGSSFPGRLLQEPSVCLLPSGKLICMMRVTAPGYLFNSESLDGGRTWSSPEETQVWGFPPNLCVLKDGRILCAYGYRRPPFGVRACISDDEGKTWDIRNEITLRNDGFHGDLGYPSSFELEDGNIFTVYYFHEKPLENVKGTYHQNAGTRYIAGSFWEL